MNTADQHADRLTALLAREAAPDVQQKIAAAQFFEMLKVGTAVNTQARNKVRGMVTTPVPPPRATNIPVPVAKPTPPVQKTAGWLDGAKQEAHLLNRAANDYYSAATAPELSRWANLKARVTNSGDGFRSQQPMDKFRRTVGNHPDHAYRNAVENVLHVDSALGGAAKKIQELAALKRAAVANPVHGIPALLKSRALTGRTLEENLGFVTDKVIQRREMKRGAHLHGAVLPVAGAVAGAGTLALVLRRRAAARAAQESEPTTTA